MSTTLRPFAIVDSAPAPQEVFVLEGYISLANTVANGAYPVYAQNPETLTQTYNQTGSTVTPNAQFLLMDMNTAVLNILYDTTATLAAGTVTLQAGLDQGNYTSATVTQDINFGAAQAFSAINSGVSLAVNSVLTTGGMVTATVANGAATAGGIVRIRLVCSQS